MHFFWFGGPTSSPSKNLRNSLPFRRRRRPALGHEVPAVQGLGEDFLVLQIKKTTTAHIFKEGAFLTGSMRVWKKPCILKWRRFLKMKGRCSKRLLFGVYAGVIFSHKKIMLDRLTFSEDVTSSVGGDMVRGRFQNSCLSEPCQLADWYNPKKSFKGWTITTVKCVSYVWSCSWICPTFPADHMGPRYFAFAPWRVEALPVAALESVQAELKGSTSWADME